MNLMGNEQDPFKDNELEIFYGIGHQVSIALERAWLHENMEHLVAQRTAALTTEISLRKEYEARIVRLNRIYSVLSGINTAIVRVREIQELFDEHAVSQWITADLCFAGSACSIYKHEISPRWQRRGKDDGYLSQLSLDNVTESPGNSSLIAEALTQAQASHLQ